MPSEGMSVFLSGTAPQYVHVFYAEPECARENVLLGVQDVGEEMEVQQEEVEEEEEEDVEDAERGREGVFGRKMVREWRERKWRMEWERKRKER